MFEDEVAPQIRMPNLINFQQSQDGVMEEKEGEYEGNKFVDGKNEADENRQDLLSDAKDSKKFAQSPRKIPLKLIFDSTEEDTEQNSSTSEQIAQQPQKPQRLPFSYIQSQILPQQATQLQTQQQIQLQVLH